MADDISKKITIGVDLDTENLSQNISNLNKTIDSLLAKQQQLTAAGQQNSAAFNSIASTIIGFQKTLQDISTQLASGVSSLTALSTSGKMAENSLSALAAQHQKTTKAAAENSVKIKELTGGLNSLNNSATQQKGKVDAAKSAIDTFSDSLSKGFAEATQFHNSITAASGALSEQATSVANNKTAFEGHKAVMDHLKASFDEIKGVSGEFGPSLEDAAKGFNVMKTGLALVKAGFNGVGEAIKADGFDFLLEVLQLLFDWFIKSSTGTKVLTGAISAIGVVVNKVKTLVKAFSETIINAFSHPIDTLKSLGRTIQENLINRFRAFGVILDGIIHLDFKKIANGTIQAFTGVTNATDKITHAFNAVKKAAKDTAKEMVGAYENGYNSAGKIVENHEKKVNASNKRIRSNNRRKVQVSASPASAVKADADVVNTTDNGVAGSPVTDAGDNNVSDTADAKELATVKKTAEETVGIKKTALREVEDYAKKSAGKIAANAINTLKDSIKQQSEAKIAALEKDKANELNNSSLTSAQKLAIEQKYKQRENQVKVKAFKEEQEVSIAQAIINGALAVTKATAQTGVFAPLEIGIVIAETTAQVAKIAAQKPPAYAAGGFHYTSDGRGGVLSGYSKTDNTTAFLRSGEGIVVSEAMQVPWARNLVSAINVGFGGRDFSIANPGRGYAVGGIFTDGGDANRYYNQPVTDQKNLANTIAYQMINNFPPVYVDVKDVNNQQNILAQTINRVNL
ncbi:MAG TPA: hypothetical protein VNW95_10715 [Mucilaginibacter sp.]|jgi:predicted  nucleic acid-binding Zn-ribbon protein|nr:hypothetical protein [Mucilaginibacter sp.]